MIDRRTAATLLAGAGLGAAAVVVTRSSSLKALALTARGNTGRLAALGVKPPSQLPFRGQANAASILTVYDLAGNTTATHAFPFPEAHALVSLGGHGYAVVSNHRHMALADAHFGVRQLLTAPDGYEFGGHAVWPGDGQSLIVTLRTDRRAEESLPGKLAVLDPSTGAMLRVVSADGFEPHDLTILSDGRLVVANYGNKRRADLMSYTSFEASLSFFSLPSLDLLQKIDGPKLGALSHLREGPRGTLALLPASLTLMNEDNLIGLTQALGGAAADVSAPEIIEQKLGGPSPILVLDVARGAWSSHLADPVKQRRPQSIAFHPGVQAWFVTYPFSEYVARLGVDGSLRFCSAFDLGLAYVRGVCVDPASGGVYVSGQFRGLAKIHPQTLAVEARFDAPLYDNVHLFALASL